MIHFDDWLLTKDEGPVIARQYDNLTRRLEILGDIPEGWSWTLLVQADKHLDLIALTPMEGGLGVDLTAEMLAVSGYYTVQLKGVRGELVRHTNQVRIFIPDSLSGDANWPEVPSEFSQMEANIRELNEHPPVPGDEGFWLVWDLERGEYVTSDLPLPNVSVGPAGKAATIKVGETVTGDPGTQAAVENTGTENEAVLRFTIPRGAVGPTGATPDISVQVTGLPAGAEPTVSVSGTPEAPVIALGIPAGRQGDPGGKGDPGDPGQTPNITIGQVETLPAGSAVTASITGETPNLVLNLGIPQGQQGDTGAGVPPADDVPTDYLLSVGGWVPPPSGGGSAPACQVWDVTVEEDVISYAIPVDDPTSYDFYIYQVNRPSGWSGNLLMEFIRKSDGKFSSNFQIAKHGADSGIIFVRPIDEKPWCLSMNYSNIGAVMATSTSAAWYTPDGTKPSIAVKNSAGNVEAGTRIVLRGYRFESV